MNTPDSAAAWLLPIHGNRKVSVGERELIYILSDSALRARVPRAPAMVREVVAWQDKLIPLFSFAAVPGNSGAQHNSAGGDDDATIVAITAYQSSNAGHVEFGALELQSLPIRIEVSADSGCGLPDDDLAWQQFAISCHEHPRFGAVPILDLARIFGSAL